MATSQSQSLSQPEEKPWHASLPSPRTTEPKAVTREELLQRFKDGQKGGRDFLLVDLRRNDHEGGTIHSSLNLPAQTLYPSLPTLYNLCTAANIPLVIFYCGSSRGRGTRGAGWLADYIEDHQNRASSVTPPSTESAILAGGIKGWVAAGEEYRSWMEGFDAAAWTIEAA